MARKVASKRVYDEAVQAVPTLYLDDLAIPAALSQARPGDKIRAVVVGRVVSRAEHQNEKTTSRSLSIALSKITPLTAGEMAADALKSAKRGRKRGRG